MGHTAHTYQTYALKSDGVDCDAQLNEAVIAGTQYTHKICGAVSLLCRSIAIRSSKANGDFVDEFLADCNC